MSLYTETIIIVFGPEYSKKGEGEKRVEEEEEEVELVQNMEEVDILLMYHSRLITEKRGD